MPAQTYRKQPVEVETMRWDGAATEVVDWIINGGGTARYVGQGEGHHLRRTSEDLDQFIVIDTLEGPHRMDVHDIAIRGVAGEHYPCKPDIFAQTYSLVEADDGEPETAPGLPGRFEAQVPEIGDKVHYQSYGTPGGEYLPQPRAAIITELKGCDPALGKPGCPHARLAVLNPTGLFFTDELPFAETPTPGHWNWPPRI